MKWMIIGGVAGSLVTSKRNGRSLFFPAAGYRFGTSPILDGGKFGCYWSSTPYEENNMFESFILLFADSDFTRCWNKRCCGQPVRPVIE